MFNLIHCRKKPKALQKAHTLKGTWSAALCFGSRCSRTRKVRSAARFSRALHLDFFEQPVKLLTSLQSIPQHTEVPPNTEGKRIIPNFSIVFSC